MKKFLSCCLLTILICCSLWMLYPFFNAYVSNNKTTVSNIKVEDDVVDAKNKQYAQYQNLNDDEKILYDFLYQRSYEILLDGQTSTTMTITNSSFDMKGIDSLKAYKAFRQDYPYLAWWLEGSTYELQKYNGVVDLSIKLNDKFADTEISQYTLKEEVITKAQNSYNNAKEIVSVDFANQSDKLNYFKEYILKNVSYDYDTQEKYADETKEKTINNYYSANFVSVFDEDDNTNVICSGYASAFQLLCDLSGISDVYYITGLAIDSSNIDNHAWNILYADSTKYLIDITNSDEGMAGQNGSLWLIDVGNNNEYIILFLFNQKIKYIENKYIS